MTTAEEQERTFVELLSTADTTKYLMLVALLCSDVGESGTGLVDGYSRNDFKRAIKGLRTVQKYTQRYAADYEDAIAHIRREWLHREATA